MSDRQKHLELIQGVINRLSTNSFQVKSWSVVIASALFALAASGKDHEVVWVALFPAIVLWGLDGYFLRQERLFRKLYDRVRLSKDEEIDFAMDTSPFATEVSGWRGTCLSHTLLPFHGVVVAVILFTAIIAGLSC